MPEINVPLLEQTLAQIEHVAAETPDDGLGWDQTAWRCQTGMCFAGWAITLTGGRWWLNEVTEENEDDGAILYAEDGDENVFFEDGMRLVGARSRATRILGLDWEQASALFHPTNNLRVLRQMVSDLKAQAAREGRTGGDSRD